MRNWRAGAIVAATFVAGCTGTIGTADTSGGSKNNGSNQGSGGGQPSGSGSGSGSGKTSGSGGGAVSGNASGSGGGSGTSAGSGGATVGPGGTPSSDCAPGIAPTSQVPRLTNAQYDRTVRDLLGVSGIAASGNVSPSTLLATDQDGSLTSLAWSAHQTVADQIATQVMADPTLKKKFISCTPSTTGAGATCFHDTIVAFGRKAFRRPLTDDEVTAFTKVVTNGAQLTATGSNDEIGQALLYMFLISPSFIMRAEITGSADSAGHYALSSYEVASRLSYMLWGSTPDDTLSAAADKNQLTTPAQILAQAQRMIQDPKAHDMVASFHQYYLLMGTNTRWDQANKDPKLFPAFSQAKVPDMENETLTFFDKVTFGGGTFQDLLLSPKAYVNANLAPLYGLNASDYGTDLKEVTLDSAQRPGFLTRLAFLNAYSAYNRTSPILRGAFITKQVLAVPIGSPPPGADTTPLPSTADLDTNRKQVDQQTSASACATCHHTYINPPGFVMEAYNTAGAWQTKEATTGAPIDTVVDAAIDGQLVHLSSPAELMAKIAASPGAQKQYANKWVSYAYQREGDPNDCGTVTTLTTKISAGGYTIANLITDLTQTDSFRMRAEVTP